jgi:hypothetical protein
MASLVLSGDTSGTITISAPAVSGSNTQTLVATTGTLAPVVSGTAVASTSGTSIDFTGIPSWVKRITVMFNGVSTSGSSQVQIQIGSGSVTTSGYNSAASFGTSAGQLGSITSGFLVEPTGVAVASITRQGSIILSLISANTWVSQGNFYNTATTAVVATSGISPALSGALDRVRITTVNGTDTFDAGTINILYE